ncbi:myb/SANT-like DNA-binding domain-containing protein 2 [Anguilla anguilla]|uniref:myb/SANT-like DNA-binding domain-containing protein 2 n=1 Tax=Anguilla anguilla TaxID=7936 RepID=UPI0015AF0EE4|nr:myb/SANT-like DNA-binding domain-containing protein 2 [Anguilla anguilla]
MAAPCNSDHSPEIPKAMEIPKSEVSSPESADLSDSNQYHSNPSTPSRFSPPDVTVSGPGSAGRGSATASSSSIPTCRGMSWTPSETNSLIAVWGSERLNEARIQQLEVAGTMFSGKGPGPAVYERVSKALAELGYERTPSQCRERMKTLRRCYSRVKEHGVGKRKSSYSLEQLEKVFGQGGWDFQPCQPVLINSSGLYQEVESDGSTMEECSQEEWCNRDLAVFPEGEMETGEWDSFSVQQPCTTAVGADDEPEESKRRRSGNGYSRRELADRRKTEIRLPKKPAQELSQGSSDGIQKQEVMRNVIRILESAQVKWEPFQTWTDFSRLHLSNKLALFGVGYATRWREGVRYHHAEISAQVPLGKRLREYFNPEKAEGRALTARVQKMNWKGVFYKCLDITISEARCLELHLEVDWVPVRPSRPAGRYALPEGVPRAHGLYAIGGGEEEAAVSRPGGERSSPEPGEPEPGRGCPRTAGSPAVTYRYLGVAEGRTLRQCLHGHFRATGGRRGQREPSPVARFLRENEDRGPPPPTVYVKFIEVELDFLSAGSLVECLETAIGYPLKLNRKQDV